MSLDWRGDWPLHHNKWSLSLIKEGALIRSMMYVQTDSLLLFFTISRLSSTSLRFWAREEAFTPPRQFSHKAQPPASSETRLTWNLLVLNATQTHTPLLQQWFTLSGSTPAPSSGRSAAPDSGEEMLFIKHTPMSLQQASCWSNRWEAAGELKRKGGPERHADCKRRRIKEPEPNLIPRRRSLTPIR